MKSGVYMIVNDASGRAYIGKATNLAVRFAAHRSNLRAGRHHCRELQADWLSLGEAAFRFVTHALLDAKELGRVECALIAEAMAGGRCYNVKASATDGRPPLDAQDRLVLRSIRLKRSDWAFIDTIGLARFRALIDEADFSAV